jgi:two-component system, sensor histidine kinase YesM
VTTLPKKLLLLIQKKRNSIAFRLLNITILLIIFPVIVASFFSYSQYTKNLEQKSAESTYQTIVQLSYSLNSYLNELFQLSSTIYYNNDLMDSLSIQNTDSKYSRYQKEWAIEEQLNETLISPRNDILSAYIISDNEIYRAGIYSKSVDSSVNCASFDWYKKALNDDNPIFVPTHLEELVTNPQYKVFSVVRRINSIQKSGKSLGVLKIDAEYSTIKSICDKIKMGTDSGLLIEDQNKSVIYSSIKNKNYSELYKIVKSNKSNYFSTNIDGEKYILCSIDIPTANWTIISVNSVIELNKTATQTRNITFLITLIISAIAIIILLLFTKEFLHPLLQIVHLMKEVQNGNLNVSFPDKRKDEIGYLGSSFNKMVLRINGMMKENTSLVKEVYETKLLQNEAQINALYSQIKPHFIFNTLNMISILIRCNEKEAAIDNIDKLSDLLRCMTRFNREITVKEEIDLLDAYLSIQKTRYRDRLEYSIDIDKSLFSYVIPALIFQPIVENAIIHGCERKKEKTAIKIYSQEEGSNIAFCFEDNANGMDRETLDALRNRIDHVEYSHLLKNDGNDNFPMKESGIGLLNVNKRIKLKFGGEYGLKIDSTENVCTCIKIILPKPANLEGF